MFSVMFGNRRARLRSAHKVFVRQCGPSAALCTDFSSRKPVGQKHHCSLTRTHRTRLVTSWVKCISAASLISPIFANKIQSGQQGLQILYTGRKRGLSTGTAYGLHQNTSKLARQVTGRRHACKLVSVGTAGWMPDVTFKLSIDWTLSRRRPSMLGIGDDPCTACCKAFAKFMASWSRDASVRGHTKTQEEFVGGTGGCTSVVTFTSWRTRSTWPAITSRFSALNFIVDRSTTSFKAFTKSTTTQSESPDCRGHDLHNLRKTARSPSTITARPSLGTRWTCR